MARNTVARTFSIGAIGGGSKADNFSAGRRHSSALLWGASNPKSFGRSLGSSRDDVLANILTPDSIPQFTIPSLLVQNGRKDPGEDPRSDGIERSGSSSSRSPAELLWRKAERCDSLPLQQRRSRLQREASYPRCPTEAQHCFDPASRAALSLPHLAKVTTPYGFVTLSQSPQMVDEEALLCRAGPPRGREVGAKPKTDSCWTDSQADPLATTSNKSDKIRRRLRVAIKKHIPFCH